nr:UDP-glucose 4-epimerase GalE [uncultured Sphaerochaeta sp.]
MQKLNILVIGGAGYIGSHIVADLVEEGHSVIVFDNLSSGFKENIPDEVELILGDIKNKSEINEAMKKNINVVFHFAALKAAGDSMIVPEKFADNNISGTLNILGAMVENDVKSIVFSSSAAVYGEPAYLPIDEKHPIVPENYYGYTKICIERNLEWFSKLKNIRYAALRYFNATGYDVKGRVKCKENNPANLSPLVMEVASGMREKLYIYGNDYDTPDGTCIRDYIHVNDLSEAHLLAMDYLLKNDKDLVVNLGTGKGASVLEVINAGAKVTGKTISHEFTARRAGDPSELIASSELARELLGWEAKYSDLENIFRTMEAVYF